MRILRIDSWDGTPGGAQDYVREVTGELARRGHVSKVIQLTNSPSILPAPVGEAIPVARGRLARGAADTTPNGALADRLRAVYREFQPDLVSLHHFDAGFATLADVLPDVDVPLVIANHDAELVCPISTLVRPGGVICEGGVRVRCLFTGCKVGLGGPYNLWQRALFDRRIAPRARVYLCPSRSLTDYLDANGYRPSVHLPSFARIPDAVRSAAVPAPDAGAPPTIGYLGRLEWYKGVDDVIDAVARLATTFPTLRLDIAGDGPFEPALRRRAAERGVADRVLFRGRLTGDAKEAWFGGVHLVVVPSSMWENFPLVAIEALQRGRPVVATRIGGIPDIVDDGETGRLVPIQDPAALAGAFAPMLADPAQARAMGVEGRRRILERFTPELHVARLLAVYDRVLAGGAFRSGGEADDLLARSA